MSGTTVEELDVLCIGAMVADLLIKPVGKYIFDNDMNTIDTLDTNLGGDAANESIVFGNYGIKVGLAGQMGEDATGDQLIQYMHENHVNTDNILRLGRTRTSVVLIQENGARNFLGYGRETVIYGKDELNPEQLKHTRMLAVGSVHILKPLDRDLIAILKAAKEAGCMTAGDMMSAKPDWPKLDMDEVLHYMDYFLPSYIEAQEMTGEDEPEKQAQWMLDRGVKVAAIKLGEEGSYFKTADGDEFRVPIFKAKVVDTTGAGDTFFASFLTGILKGWSVRKSATFASAAGAIAVTGMGATGAIQSLEQVEALMKENGRYIED